MSFLVGVDEAGYGPNLGPLAIAATLWHVDDTTHAGGSADRGEQVDLYKTLSGTVTRTPTPGGLAIADSKTLYKPGSGLRLLECGVHAAMHVSQQPAPSWSELTRQLFDSPHRDGHPVPWQDQFDCQLPRDVSRQEVNRLGQCLTIACQQRGVRPILVRARLTQPAEFNELTQHYESKAAALSHITLALVREVVAFALDSDDCPSPIHIVCDKHGGRNRYAALLQHHFSEHWIETMVESRAVSCYSWGPPAARCECVFRAGGEDFLPAALASMVAKYLREISMQAFNAYWSAHVPGLKPTAGYPLDARRFKDDIAHAQRRLHIADRVLWRNR